MRFRICGVCGRTCSRSMTLIWMRLLRGWGCRMGGAFRIRFCQYDNNPAPKDGVFLRGIAVRGDQGPMLHLRMDDNGLSPVVADSSAGGNDQVFVDPGGDPNTSAHSVAGVVGTGLSFDGVDDLIDLGTTVDAALAAGHDFAVTFWWARGAGNDENAKYIYRKPADNGSIQVYNCYYDDRVVTQFNVFRSHTPEDRVKLSCMDVGYDWNHYVFLRRGDTFEVWTNGTLTAENIDGANVRAFSGPSGFVLGGSGSAYATGAMDDFRVYDRALYATEILELATAP